MTIDEICDLAKKNCGISSDRELARLAKLSPGALTFYRTKRSWPSDDTIIKLAELAKIDAAEAIIELNYWRSEGPARSIYHDILIRLRQTAAIILLALFAGAAGQGYVSEAQAKPAPALSSPGANTLYYGKYCNSRWTVFIGWLRRLISRHKNTFIFAI